MRNTQAITSWCDESSCEINSFKYHVMGMLITDSDRNELDFLGDLIDARRNHKAWNVLHGCTLKNTDMLSMKLLGEWLNIFKNNKKVCFHIFVYKENEIFMTDGFEKYFAKQSAFGLGCKMRKIGCQISTMFSNVGTVTFLFDNRRDEGNNVLGSEYKNEIKKQLRSVSHRADDLTVRFSFVNSGCFNAMQLADALLYMVKLRIDKENGETLTIRQQKILKLWEDNFLDSNIKCLSDYSFDEKFNYFFSNR